MLKIIGIVVAIIALITYMSDPAAVQEFVGNLLMCVVGGLVSWGGFKIVKEGFGKE